jgi:hypothetical protein
MQIKKKLHLQTANKYIRLTGTTSLSIPEGRIEKKYLDIDLKAELFPSEL